MIRKYITAISLLFCASVIHAQTNNFLLIGRTTGTKILSNNDTIRTFGFAETLSQYPDVPGPILEMNEGDSVTIDFWNVSQGAPHTIHLHGLDVDQANDGVPHLSFEVYHMDHGYYNFVAPHAGTYLYHCHVVSTVHVQAGMYGMIIVRPPNGGNSTWDGGIDFDQEHIFFMSEIDTVWHNDSILDHEYDTSATMNMVEIPEYYPQHFLVNGLSDQQLVDSIELNTSVNATNYLRLANLGYYRNRLILPTGLNTEIVSTDGRPLPNYEQTDTVNVYPGERYGIICEASSEFIDSIAIEYIDMNTGLVKNTQYVDVNVSGYFDINEPKQPEISIYPNPFNDNIFVTSTAFTGSDLKVNIFDVNGRLVKSIDFSNISNSFKIDGSDLKSGIYFLQLITPEYTTTKRIVK